jgi:hypothetical protein
MACVARVWRNWWGWDRSDAGASVDGGDVAVDGAPVEGLTVVAFDEHPGTARSAVVAVVGDELDQDRVQRDVAVVVELADGDPQPG